jgi:hypothetical protein
VDAGGLGADEQRLGGLAVAASRRDQVEHLAGAPREGRDLGVEWTCAEAAGFVTHVLNNAMLVTTTLLLTS